MLFSLLVSVLFFHKNFLQVYIQEAGEGTSPILSFLHPFVMIWNKKLSAESNIFAREAQNSPDIYAYLLFYHYDLCLINLPAPVIDEAIKYIMHTSMGAKLFISKLDYCLKVDESSTNAKKTGYVYVFALNFQ